MPHAPSDKILNEMKARFEKNMTVLQEYQPNIHAVMSKFEEDSLSSLIYDENGKVINMVLNDDILYNNDADVFADKQLKNYFQTPTRYVLTAPRKRKQHLPTVTNDFFNVIADYVSGDDSNFHSDIEDMKGGGLAIFGLGLGYHIDELLDKLEVDHVYIVDQFDIFLYYSMHIHDIGKWYEKFKGGRHKLRFLFSDDAKHISDTLFSAINGACYGNLDGSFIFLHIKSYNMNKSYKYFYERLPNLNANPGFFEDEMFMMQNTSNNLLSYDYHLFKQRDDFCSKTTPAIIVGSGPSLDNDIQNIKAIKDDVIIFSCGTGLEALLSNDIKPDFHVELENTPDIPVIIKRMDDLYDLSGITLIMSTTVRKEVSRYFDERIYFFRDLLSSSLLYGMDAQTQMASPTVTNTAMRMTTGFYFDKIYMFGVDFSTRVGGVHHSQSTIYFKDKKYLEERPNDTSLLKNDFVRKANFGGNIVTHGNFLFAYMFMDTYIRNQEVVEIYNCSDGIYMESAIPILSSVAKDRILKDRHIHEKADTIELIKSEMKYMQAGEVLSFEKLEAIEKGLPGLFNRLNGWILNYKKNPYDYKNFYLQSREMLDEIIIPTGDAMLDDINKTYLQFIKGSVLIFVTYNSVCMRRATNEASKKKIKTLTIEYMEILVAKIERELTRLVADIREMKQLSDSRRLKAGADPLRQ